MSQLISNENVVYYADKNNKPVISIKSGDSVIFQTLDCYSQQVRKPEDSAANIAMDHLNPVTGPVYIDDMQPGDTLEVHIEEIKIGNQGITTVAPGLGLLYDEFTEPKTKISQIIDGIVHFSDNIKIV